MNTSITSDSIMKVHVPISCNDKNRKWICQNWGVGIKTITQNNLGLKLGYERISRTFVDNIYIVTCKNQIYHVFKIGYYLDSLQTDLKIFFNENVEDLIEDIIRKRSNTQNKKTLRTALFLIYEFAQDEGLIKEYDFDNWDFNDLELEL